MTRTMFTCIPSLEVDIRCTTYQFGSPTLQVFKCVLGYVGITRLAILSCRGFGSSDRGLLCFDTRASPCHLYCVAGTDTDDKLSCVRWPQVKAAHRRTSAQAAPTWQFCLRTYIAGGGGACPAMELEIRR